MKISGDKLIEVYHTWLKGYFSNVRLTSTKVNWLKLPLAKNAPVSPTAYSEEYGITELWLWETFPIKCLYVKN